MCRSNFNVPYGTMEKKDNTDLISDILKNSPAFISGGIKFQVEKDNKRVIMYSNGCLDFVGVGIFNSLGIFKVSITANQKQQVLIVIE